MIFTENEGLVDKHGHHLMPAMPIFQKHGFFEKGPKSQQFLKKLKIFFCISCSIFIGLFNGPLFVFIMSMVGGTQKETLLPSHLNWPPLYDQWFKVNYLIICIGAGYGFDPLSQDMKTRILSDSSLSRSGKSVIVSSTSCSRVTPKMRSRTSW